MYRNKPYLENKNDGTRSFNERQSIIEDGNVYGSIGSAAVCSDESVRLALRVIRIFKLANPIAF